MGLGAISPTHALVGGSEKLLLSKMEIFSIAWVHTKLLMDIQYFRALLLRIYYEGGV